MLLSSFFAEKLEDLNCDARTRAYITGLFSSYISTAGDLSKDSITLIYTEAKNRQAFDMFNKLGDWLFYCETIYPEHLNAASKDYYHSIGRLSYYSCYRLMDRRWLLFQELADNFITLTYETRIILNQ